MGPVTSTHWPCYRYQRSRWGLLLPPGIFWCSPLCFWCSPISLPSVRVAVLSTFLVFAYFQHLNFTFWCLPLWFWCSSLHFSIASTVVNFKIRHSTFWFLVFFGDFIFLVFYTGGSEVPNFPVLIYPAHPRTVSLSQSNGTHAYAEVSPYALSEITVVNRSDMRGNRVRVTLFNSYYVRSCKASLGR